MILPDHPRGEEALRRAETLCNADGWHYALTWADNAESRSTKRPVPIRQPVVP